MQTEGPKLRKVLLELHQISAFCGSSHAGNLKFGANTAQKSLNITLPQPRINSDTPPRDIFNAKKIILKLDLFMQSLKKIGKEMPKIESEKPIYNVIQGP